MFCAVAKNGLKLYSFVLVKVCCKVGGGGWGPGGREEEKNKHSFLSYVTSFINKFSLS